MKIQKKLERWEKSETDRNVFCFLFGNRDVLLNNFSAGKGRLKWLLLLGNVLHNRKMLLKKSGRILI